MDQTDPEHFRLFVTAPKGVGQCLAEELRSFGALHVKPGLAGAYAKASLPTMYRICLWSRLASRVLLELAHFRCRNVEELYEGVLNIDWPKHFSVDHDFIVEFTGSLADVRNTQFGALKVKDALVDRFRRDVFSRPSVNKEDPDIRVVAHVHRDRAIIYLDAAGQSLHRRGYRQRTIEAPLKENLAAAMLMLANWPQFAREKKTLIDPMAGSGTILIEAAWMAGDMAPGLFRKKFGFHAWHKHQPDIWQQLIQEAEERKIQGQQKIPPIYGFDLDPNAIQAMKINLRAAGMLDSVHISQGNALDFIIPPETASGLLITNPPYGQRLGTQTDTWDLYQQFGARLKKDFINWKIAVLGMDSLVGQSLGIQQDPHYQQYELYNGPLPCILHTAEILPLTSSSGKDLTAQVEAFTNRLKKNEKKLVGWAKQLNISCYRLYDRDLPDFALAIDRYQEWLHVQEFKAPKDIPEETARARLQAAMVAIKNTLNISSKNIFLKTRQRQIRHGQYERLTHSRTSTKMHVVTEGNYQFLVNFIDHIDTGLFLDHRRLRELVGTLAKQKRFLNLYSYTGTATVYAAGGGALSTVSVDLSKTYQRWAQDNLAQNHLASSQHQMIVDDCQAWLKECQETFDLILLAPPTFSKSKRMQHSMDLQRDHPDLIRLAITRLSKEGILLFSVSGSRFKFSYEDPQLEIREITQQTLPKDFEHSKSHRVWRMQFKST